MLKTARLTPQEAQDAYFAVAEEMPELTEDDLDPAMVEAAKHYAHETSSPWPPVPRTTGWMVSISSSRI